MRYRMRTHFNDNEGEQLESQVNHFQSSCKTWPRKMLGFWIGLLPKASLYLQVYATSQREERKVLCVPEKGMRDLICKGTISTMWCKGMGENSTKLLH